MEKELLRSWIEYCDGVEGCDTCKRKEECYDLFAIPPGFYRHQLKSSEEMK